MPGGRRPRHAPVASLATVLALTLAACGGGSDAELGAEPRPASAPTEFPDPGGATLESFFRSLPSSDLVASPAGQVFVRGSNRFGFGVFTVGGEEVADADVALYAAPGEDGEVSGPFPARIESLETEPAFTARTTADDPDSARVFYASEVRFDQPGEWRLLAVIRDGEEYAATRLPSVTVESEDPVPAPGERAPRIHTPTVDDVGAIGEIDTRVPHSTLHEDDFAEVLGEEPAVLVFATPALCQSRVCGPVVDIAEQVKRDYGEQAAFIYMEIFEDNDPAAGVREQVRAFNLPTEPWLFVVDADGRIDTRIEGAFSVAELETAVERVVG